MNFGYVTANGVNSNVHPAEIMDICQRGQVILQKLRELYDENSLLIYKKNKSIKKKVRFC